MKISVPMYLKKMRGFSSLGILLSTLLAWQPALAAEGMWTLDNLPMAKMQAEYGYKPSAEWVKKVMLSSARMAFGCSGSFISKDGLVMTNHHCAAECIEQLSSAQKNYLTDGFLSKTRADEQKCPAMEVNRLEDIQDVTEQVKKATAGLSGTAYKQAQNGIRAKLTSACVGENKSNTRCDLVDLYHGGQYKIYKYHRFSDVRLVWAPEKAIAFFGGDPDNFNFPRFDLDISLVRVYENDKPVAIKDFFTFNPQGAEEKEMVFVTGHPGRTQRQLTVAQLLRVRDMDLIDGMLRTAELRGVIEQYQKTSAEAARVAEGTLFGIENGYKARYGQLQTLLEPSFLIKKQAEENALKKFVASKPAMQARIGGAWDAIEKAQKIHRELGDRMANLEGGRAFNSEYFFHARDLVRGIEEKAKANTERLPEFSDARLPEVEEQIASPAPIYPEFEKVKLTFGLTKMREILGVDDPLVKKVLGNKSPEQLADELVKQTKLGDVEVRKALWKGGAEAIAKSDDAMIKLVKFIDADARSLRKRYEQEVDSVVQKNSELIAEARFAQTGTGAYPDATFSLRLSYGEVKGWEHKGEKIPAYTDFAGAFKRETGADPFALPASWHKAKANLNLAQRFNFVTTNDIIGGNSGSPMINKNGEIVGLIFDGNIHSLGGAFWYDGSKNRAVAVHSGGILEALNKIYDGKRIADEMLGK